MIRIGRYTAAFKITAHGESFGPVNMRRPRMDLTVIFPQGKVPPELEVNVGSGAVRLDKLPGAAHVTIDVKNGEIFGEHIGGTSEALRLAAIGQ